MSYFQMHGIGRAMQGFAGPEDCTTGEFWDEPSETCLCQAGLTPSPVVGGGCISVKSGGTTGDACLMKGMDYDIASQSCIPRCPPGYGHDTSGKCVSKLAYDRAHGLIPSGGGAPQPGSPEEIAKASMPWLIGAAVGVGALALFALAAGKKKPERSSSYQPNRRAR